MRSNGCKKGSRMRFFVTLLFLAILLVLFALHEFNPGTITVNLLPSKSYDISRSALEPARDSERIGMGAGCEWGHDKRPQVGVKFVGRHN